jgi:nucleoside-diphosphate-sugar epimerase
LRVLVTGGGGYIGSVLVPRLLARGHGVRVVDRLYWGLQPLRDVLDRIEVIHADVREPEDAWLRDIDGVVHLAGLSNDPTANFDPEANWQMNALATATLAAACRRLGVERFVFGSSCSLYDGLPDGAVYDEDAPIAPRGPYAESKRFAEEALLSGAGPDFRPVILRQGTVYGLSPRMRFDLVVNTFTRDALTEGRLLLHGGGWMWRPLVDVQDAADAQIACLEAPAEAVRGEIFNVVHDNYQIRDLANEVAAAVARAKGRVVIDFAPEPALVRNYRCSNHKLHERLGFQPLRDVGQAVSELVDSFAALRREEFAHPRFYNLDWLLLLTEAQAALQPFDYVLRRGEQPRRSE